MAVVFNNLTSDAGLKKLDEYLLTRSYITGYQASKDDLTVYSSLSKAPSAEYVNVSRWYKHIDALLRISGVSAEGSGVTIEGAAPAPEEAVATPPAADAKASAAEEDDDDDVDLFGEETEEEKKAAEERAAAVKASSKKKESGKSSVLLDVKPWDDETDMKKLEEAVRSVHMDGLLFGASKLVPVGYGIKKLQDIHAIGGVAGGGIGGRLFAIGSGGGGDRRLRPQNSQSHQALKCPRCDSLNTKFCYYNNYSLSQPRHFCKNCRSYWTNGDVLRNVPVGGGCRKAKRSKPKQSSTSDDDAAAAATEAGVEAPQREDNNNTNSHSSSESSSLTATTTLDESTSDRSNELRKKNGDLRFD